jgi:hypothetical protein
MKDGFSRHWASDVQQNAKIQYYSYSSYFLLTVEHFQPDSYLHILSTRLNTYNLQNANISEDTGIKLFSNLPFTVKSLNHDMKLFMLALREYVIFDFCTE